MSASRMGPHGNRRGTDHRLKTDSDISAAAGNAGRQLQRWTDEDADSTPDAKLADMSLDSLASDGGKWDQFAANREKFGVVPSYDELLYTTEVNKSHPDYVHREQRAAQLAKEIESQGHNGNVHLAEERGAVIDDSGMDEEDRYSGVARAKQTQQLQEFANAEAEKAMASSNYLRNAEKADRQKDQQKFSQRIKAPGDDGPSSQGTSSKNSGNSKRANSLSDKSSDKSNDKVSDKSSDKASGKAGAKAAAETQGNQSSSKPSAPSEKGGSNDSKQKKKFNFSASAARSSSFKASVSPSPRQSFSPVSMPSPGAVHPPVLPAGMPPMFALSGPPSPFAFPPPAGMPGMGPPPGGMPPMPGFHLPGNGAPPYGNGSGLESPEHLSRTGSAIDLSSIKTLDDAFDYIKTLTEKEEPIPKMYTTTPTWSTTSQVSYVDQFPVAAVAPRVPQFMPPMGYMYSPQF